MPISYSIAGELGGFLGYETQGGKIINFQLFDADGVVNSEDQTVVDYGYLGNNI